MPKPRHLTRWIMTDRRDAEETHQLVTELAACHELHATPEHVRKFVDLMNKHRGDRLTDWIHRVQATPMPALH